MATKVVSGGRDFPPEDSAATTVAVTVTVTVTATVLAVVLVAPAPVAPIAPVVLVVLLEHLSCVEQSPFYVGWHFDDHPYHISVPIPWSKEYVRKEENGAHWDGDWWWSADGNTVQKCNLEHCINIESSDGKHMLHYVYACFSTSSDVACLVVTYFRFRWFLKRERDGRGGPLSPEAEYGICYRICYLFLMFLKQKMLATKLNFIFLKFANTPRR